MVAGFKDADSLAKDATGRRWKEVRGMRSLKYTYWQEDDFFIGYLNDYPALSPSSFLQMKYDAQP